MPENQSARVAKQSHKSAGQDVPTFDEELTAIRGEEFGPNCRDCRNSCEDMMENDSQGQKK